MVVVASDVALVVMCHGCRRSTAAVAVGDGGDMGRWCQVSWMVVGRKRLLIIDDAKLSVSVC